jgi:hypothetical protein
VEIHGCHPSWSKISPLSHLTKKISTLDSVENLGRYNFRHMFKAEPSSLAEIEEFQSSPKTKHTSVIPTILM